MKILLRRFFSLYLLFIVLFQIQKPIFLLLYGHLAKSCSDGDILSVMFHGFPLDLSMASYLMVLPALAWSFKGFTHKSWPWLRRVGSVYFFVVAILISLTFLLNISLYGYWHFPLDNTPIFYFTSSPTIAVASVSAWTVVGAVLLWLVLTMMIWFLCYRIAIYSPNNIKKKYMVMQAVVAPPSEGMPRYRFFTGLLMLVLGGLLIIPIRGGLSVATMNIGTAYYSAETVFNHAAVNPMFSLLESMLKTEDFKKQYRFMKEEEAAHIFAGMLDDTSTAAPRPANFMTKPNVIIIVMESFSSKLLTITGGLPNVAINLDSVARKNVLFTNFYANSFRTDRGLVAVLSGYPAQPTMSIMKYPSKTAHLPSICGTLVKNGYTPTYYYGGDANFTNMRSYLVAQGFTKIISEDDFPRAQKNGKWGVNDGNLFKKVWSDFQQPQRTPFFKVIQTSSSHEPFDVPYHRLADKRLNAFAYSDSIIGDFLRKFSQTEYWKNSLVVMVPDHLGAYPPDLDLLHLDRYQIPLIVTGGCITAPRRIPVLGSQQDIAATLLASLGYSHKDFKFSKDMLNPKAPHFAFFAAPDVFGLVTPDNAILYDNTSQRLVVQQGKNIQAGLRAGQAYLQSLYNDIAERH